jgi:NAD(P)-dependent dehydrogenase (short-subunit alcohol dehydrogenase family)
MPTQVPLVVLITGASSGIGAVCADHLAALGHRVYGTSRRAPALSPEALAQSPYPRLIPMDVTDDASVARGVGLLLTVEGRLDVLVNNAGNGIAGAIEDTPIELAKGQLETNFWGMVRLCQAALPAMRAQRSGLIVNISSMAGRMGIPYQAFYSASKFAIEGATEALRLEVAPCGVRACLIEPGDFCTGFTAHRQRCSRAETGGIYTETCERALGVMEHDEQNGPTPKMIAQTLARIIATPHPRLRYPVGRPVQKLALLLKGLLPGQWFEAILRGNYKL